MKKNEVSLAKQLVFCFFCERKINKMTKVYCEDCKDIFICLKCFIEGRESREHKRDHQYRILDKLNFSLFGTQWTAREEINLLEGLQQFGYGNWKAISKHLNSDKDMVDCEKHFHEVYLDRKGMDLAQIKDKSFLEEEGEFYICFLWVDLAGDYYEVGWVEILIFALFGLETVNIFMINIC
jgi:hypothetical protein